MHAEKPRQEEAKVNLDELFRILEKFNALETILSRWYNNEKNPWSFDINKSKEVLSNALEIAYTYSKSSIVSEAISIEIERSKKELQESYKRLEAIEIRLIKGERSEKNSLAMLSYNVYESLFGYYNGFSLLRVFIGIAVAASEGKDLLYQSAEELLFAVKEEMSRISEDPFVELQRFN
ncbi:MAG: hypothetical protein ACP5LP_03820 [Candidatus Micrarchaeia archaeon]